MSRAASLARGLALLGICLIGAAACESERTETVVRIWAENGVSARAQALEVVLRAGSGVDPTSYVVTGSEHFNLAVDELALPLDVAIVPADGDASRHFELVARMTDAEGATIAQARAISGFVEGRTLQLNLWLGDGCVGIECPAAQTCRTDATCMDAHVDPATLGDLVPRPAPTPLDAAVEPVPNDAGPPLEREGGAPRPTCALASECDDANPCTDDACEATHCVHHANVAPCDDGVGCSHDDACRDGVCTGIPGCVVGTCSRLTGECECAPGVPGCSG